MTRPRTGRKVTTTIRVEPNVRTALEKKREGRESFSSVIVRLLGDAKNQNENMNKNKAVLRENATDGIGASGNVSKRNDVSR
jgi:predicted CopG family antitoxin